MYNEQQELLNEVYRHYLMEDAKILPNMSKEKMTELGYGLSQEEFINKCKTNPEFSERWGLQIDERELSLNERVKLFSENVNGEHLMKYADSDGLDVWNEILNKHKIPTKLITTTKITKIESYE